MDTRSKISIMSIALRMLSSALSSRRLMSHMKGTAVL
jgi:hypothetical protein